MTGQSQISVDTQVNGPYSGPTYSENYEGIIMKTSKITFTITPLAFNPVHGRLWPMPAYTREVHAASLAEAIRHAKAGLTQWRDRGETMAATSCEAFTVEYAGVGGTQSVEVSLT